MRPVYFAAARRTPIGKLHGSLSNVRPDDLAATVLRGLLADVQALDPARIDDVYWGAANQSGEDNRNVARMSVLLAGLPDTVPGATFNRLCGSGMEAVIIAARTIAADEADVVVAGGSDSMSRAPTNPSRERSIPTTHASAGDSPTPGWPTCTASCPWGRPPKMSPRGMASPVTSRTPSPCAATSAPPPTVPAPSTPNSCRSNAPTASR